MKLIKKEDDIKGTYIRITKIDGKYHITISALRVNKMVYIIYDPDGSGATVTKSVMYKAGDLPAIKIELVRTSDTDEVSDITTLCAMEHYGPSTREYRDKNGFMILKRRNKADRPNIDVYDIDPFDEEGNGIVAIINLLVPGCEVNHHPRRWCRSSASYNPTLVDTIETLFENCSDAASDLILDIVADISSSHYLTTDSGKYIDYDRYW